MVLVLWAFVLTLSIFVNPQSQYLPKSLACLIQNGDIINTSPHSHDNIINDISNDQTDLKSAIRSLRNEAKYCKTVTWSGSQSSVDGRYVGNKLGRNTTKVKTEFYSAFYDDRYMAGLQTSVHVISASFGNYDEDSLNKLYCYLWYVGIKTPVVKHASLKHTEKTTSISGTQVNHNILTCSLQVAFPHPSFISLESSVCDLISNSLPVFIPVRQIWKYEIGMCLYPSARPADAYKLIEWLETYRLLGVEHVTLYDLDLSDEVMKVMHNYELRGYVTLRSIMPPDGLAQREARVSNIIHYLQPIMQNDCLLHTMYKYKFVIFSNFDQLLVPREHKSYQAMLINLNKRAPARQTSFYKIQAAYFFCQFSSNTPSSHKIMWTEYYQTRVAKLGDGPADFQLIVNPRMCSRISKNSCIQGEIADERKSADVSHILRQDMVLSQVYRRCNGAVEHCSLLMSKRTDSFFSKYVPQLKERIKQIIDMIKPDEEE